ncbi:MAG: hypothetical protein JW940_15390 [Polyangiaceae bacterium]|nr:hypothetical protein [Polyangiaceae bacterium]
MQQIGDGQYMTILAMALTAGRVRYSGLHQDILVHRRATDTVDRVETRGIWLGLEHDISGLLEDDIIQLSPCRPGVSLARSGWPPPDYRESSGAPTVLYNGMIAPLVPYAIRGVIWYQGEANVGRERQYRTLFPALIADWRRTWGQGGFPFLFVQIAPFSGMTPEIREAQLLSWQSTKNTAMVVTTDCGDPGDIHPAHKQPVGTRLALAARALAYGEKIEYSGPVYARP